MPSWMNTDKQPCGTAAAYRRHLRRGEKPCEACKAADRLRTSTGERRPLAIDTRERRNGLPDFRPYVWRDPKRGAA